MSIQGYYRRTLALPLAVPALASALFLVGDHLPAGLIGVALWLSWSLMFGGIPYLLFAVGFLLWMRGRTDREVRGAVLLSPLVYALVLMGCLFAFLALDGNSDGSDVLMFGAFGVLFGYGYVLLAEVGRVLLRPGRAEPVPAA